MKKNIDVYSIRYKTDDGYEVGFSENGNLYLKSPKFNDSTYAFYIYYRDNIEKEFYSDNNIFESKNIINEGVYLFSFFKKNSKGDRERKNIELFFLRNYGFVDKKGLVISESNNYIINFHPRDSDVLFVVFNGSGSLKSSKPFGLKFLLEKNYNVITCNQNNDQYQGLSYEIFQELVSPFICNKRVFLYGSSLGGYCAVYYGGAINGTIIAAAPRNSAHPSMIERRVKTSYKKETFKHKDIGSNNKSNQRVYIFVDPFEEEDVFFIEKFIKPVYSDLSLIEAPHAGHQVLYHINKIKKLSEIITNIVEGDRVDNILLDQETEFTLYGKVLYLDKQMRNALKKIKKIKNINPVIETKLKDFFVKLKNES